MWYKDLGTHYEYIATYVDDLMIASKNPRELIKKIEEIYRLKGVEEPKYYLGGNVEVLGEEWSKSGIRWGLSAKTYLENVIPKLQNLMGKLFSLSSAPMSESYHPELDESPFVNQEIASKYRSMIGSLNWAITLGRFDVQHATSTMARYSMAPREGHV